MRRARRSTRGRILQVDLAAFPDEPLHRRIYLSIQRDIVEGLLHPGADVPSTRQLASDLDVARGTVVMAYDQLRAEGYFATDIRGGTRVSSSVPDVCMRAPKGSMFPDTRSVGHQASRRAQTVAVTLDQVPVDIRGTAPRAFRSTLPAIDVFPIDIWARIAGRQLRRATTRDLSYADPMGYLPLRRTIAEYVRATRGVRCTPEQILVVSGTQQAIDITLRALIDPGDAVWMEDPGYFGFRGAIQSAGGRVIPIGVDDEGLNVTEGRAVAPDARVAVVTPMHQVPLCLSMSHRRRIELLEWASETGSWIVEDDYNSDFQYATQPTGALQSMDRADRVVYCGTFSKSLFPGLRVGFIVVPEPVIAEFRAIRFFTDIQPAYLDQATLAEFIAEGHYERHIRRLRAIYQPRRELLLEGLDQCARWLSPTRHDSGREITVWLKPELDDILVAQAADRAGITVVPLSTWATAHTQPPSLRLGYSGIDERDIRAGTAVLSRVLDAITSAASPRIAGQSAGAPRSDPPASRRAYRSME